MRILKHHLTRRVLEALKFHDELAQAGMTRRQLLKVGAITGGAALAASIIRWPETYLGAQELSSPPTDPWVQSLTIPPVLQPVSPASLVPGPDATAHQYYLDFPPQKHYLMTVQERSHTWHPQLPASTAWGYNGRFPGPTLDGRYGEPILLRILNELPAVEDHRGFGIPEVITHLHNGHTASESDGGPWNWTRRGQYTDHHYLQARAGFTVPQTIPSEFRDLSGGDVRETLTTLFFHYHRPDVTTEGVYKGLIGFWRNFDEQDTGDEEDSSSQAWRLPSGRYDIPLAFADKTFDPRTGQLYFDSTNFDGVLGDKTSVNGRIQPFLDVQRQKYRFRVLNGGPARFYTLVLRHEGRNQPFTQITHSGNLLERPRRNLTRLEIQVAERSDIIIDFSQFESGDRVYLSNVLPMKDGRQPERDRSKALNPDDVKNQLLEFRIEGSAPDPSLVPDAFRPFPPVVMSEVVRRRNWQFERGNGSWQINDRNFDVKADHMIGNLNNPRHQIRRNTAEIWTLENTSGGWEHPAHIHLEEGQVLRINGRDVLNNQATRQRTDMYRLGQNTRVELFMRFRDFPDPNFSQRTLGERTRYVMHCHNTTP